MSRIEMTPAFRRLGFLILLVGGVIGCSTDVNLPPGIQDPNSFRTPDGAMGLYRKARQDFGVAVVRAAFVTGILTDELHALPNPFLAIVDVLDARLVPESSDPRDATDFSRGSYTDLQNLRASAALAIGALAAYAPASSPVLRGELYASEAYAEVLLADVFCSGVPLSTLDFNADYTYRTGSTTAQLYEHAIALFDTALVLSTSDVNITSLAAIGKGRALMGLGRYADAALAVAGVATTFNYQFTVEFANISSPFSDIALDRVGESDREGGVGLLYATSGDPRTAASSHTSALDGTSVVYVPHKFDFGSGATSRFTVASGIEARLIEAEARYNAGDALWIDGLNTLRAMEVVPALPALDNPGMPSDSSVTLLFNERAAWLFLTGHRQGDLRRLIRQYHRSQSSVYPTGFYPLAGQGGVYGTDVTVPIPPTERLNPVFAGCKDHNA